MSSTTSCPHCQRELKPRMIAVCGIERQAGFEPCQCDGAKAEREALAMAELHAQRERERAAMEGKLRAAGVPERYIAAEHEKAAKIADAVEGGEGFYVHGTQGTGKTHLAMAAARVLVGRGYAVKVHVAPRLMEAMRSRSIENRDLTESLARCRVLVLDDLGKEAPTAYACERLFDIVNERYNAMLPVIVTSNYSRGEIARKLTEGDVGRSIASRLCEMTRSVHMDGADRRVSHG